jgi:hypothetical protein
MSRRQLKEKILVTGIILISFSVFYSLFLKDFVEKLKEERCFDKVDKEYDSGMQKLDTRKENLDKEKEKIEGRMQSMPKELDEIDEEVREEFGRDTEKQRVIEERTESDLKQQSENRQKCIRGESFYCKFLNEYKNEEAYTDSEEVIRGKVAQNLEKEYILNHQKHLKKGREIEDAKIRLQEIEIELKELDRKTIELKEEYEDGRDYCLKRY